MFQMLKTCLLFIVLLLLMCGLALAACTSKGKSVQKQDVLDKADVTPAKGDVAAAVEVAADVAVGMLLNNGPVVRAEIPESALRNDERAMIDNAELILLDNGVSVLKCPVAGRSVVNNTLMLRNDKWINGVVPWDYLVGALLPLGISG